MTGSPLFDKAACLIQQAGGLLITAGAGMGVDSGLPDFRGTEGFWNAYPALAQAGIDFTSIANPIAFRRDPRLAWGFYGHRLALYRRTEPHEGFRLLRGIAASLPCGSFVFTSNVDGQFQKAGFDLERIHEIHGSIHHLQCSDTECTMPVWSAENFEPDVDEAGCRLSNGPPTCPICGQLARPNILMFGDCSWRPERSGRQAQRLKQWLAGTHSPVVIEIGAGTGIPSVRLFGERFDALIRINPREAKVKGRKAVGIVMGGLEAIRGIYDAIQQLAKSADRRDRTRQS